MNFETKDKLDKARLLFSPGSFQSLNIIGKFIKTTFKKRENDNTANAIYIETFSSSGSMQPIFS